MKDSKVWYHIKMVLIGFDQLINTFLLGACDESLSARAWRHYQDGSRKWPKILIDAILFFDKNHCKNSYLSEIERRQYPPEYREQKQIRI